MHAVNHRYTVLPEGGVIGGALPSPELLLAKLRELGMHERTREEREAELMAAFVGEDDYFTDLYGHCEDRG